jgi:hypothetical protein
MLATILLFSLHLFIDIGITSNNGRNLILITVSPLFAVDIKEVRNELVRVCIVCHRRQYFGCSFHIILRFGETGGCTTGGNIRHSRRKLRFNKLRNEC